MGLFVTSSIPFGTINLMFVELLVAFFVTGSLAHPQSMGPKMDFLLYAILGSLLRNRFVSPLWIRQTDT